MKYLIVIALSLSVLAFTACQKEEEKESQTISSAHISKPLKAKIERSLPESEPKITLNKEKKDQKKNLSESLGITVDDGKIIIDTKQTKDFFHSISEQMKSTFKNIENSLRKDKVKSSDEIGIEVSDTTISIDLNKTKNFMEKWTHSMENVVRELNRTMSDIEKNLPKR